MVEGVLASALAVSAPTIDTFCVGSETPAMFGAQASSGDDDGITPGSPLMRRFAASGAAIGAGHPGKAMSGSDIVMPPICASCAGQEACCMTAKMPSDCQPML